ncbi:3-hydroxyacyl-CoA dehydrogenase family protein [Crossiella sp. SN42]|uniref:3-hydroxyacyl-CoA dehydrogenase family protein n=1 Tax=Crossiella sp. SN42 TaxID=2944808 RepID=UPI00207D712E|nr:3-hydroxyacyl-CoA dehydrogenase family protein [Crossiella sp. SN42]MCO1579133.1 3-hydroxyacyl-CoA dehydrogenase family protein [Crossiella sp. SN42]
MPTVGIVGAGVMGKDVAITCAAYGYDVVLCDHDPGVLASAARDIRTLVRRYRLMAPDEPCWNDPGIPGRIRIGEDLAVLAGADWIVENVVEDVAVKEQVHRELREVGGAGSRIAVNTSCVSITRIAALAARPEEVIGMHFMNPVPLIKCVELVRGHHTSDETTKQAEAFVSVLGKRPVVVRDMPGFVSNRLSHLFMNEAAFLVQEGVAEPEQIDAIFTLGYGHKMGPLATADLIGLNTVVDSLQVLYDDMQDPKFRCCPLLKRMVAAGLVGRKSGQGFYTYTASR